MNSSLYKRNKYYFVKWYKSNSNFALWKTLKSATMFVGFNNCNSSGKSIKNTIQL